MEEPKSLANFLGDNNDEGFDGSRAARPFIGVITLTAVLYLGKEVLLPVAMAAMLAVIFSPVANRLDRFVGSFISAALVVMAAITVVGAIGYFLPGELTSVAAEVAGYSDNIGTKLTALEKSTPSWLQRVERGVATHRGVPRFDERGRDRAGRERVADPPDGPPDAPPPPRAELAVRGRAGRAAPAPAVGPGRDRPRRRGASCGAAFGGSARCAPPRRGGARRTTLARADTRRRSLRARLACAITTIIVAD